MKNEIEVSYIVETKRKCKIQSDKKISASDVAYYLGTNHNEFNIKVLKDTEEGKEIVSLEITKR